MSDPAKDPSLEADDDDLSGDQGKRSGERPAARFYEPLPLGSNAFAAPLAPVPSERPGPLARIPVIALVLLGAAGLAGAAVGVAIALRSAAKAPEPAASPAARSVAIPAATVDAPAAAPAHAAGPAVPLPSDPAGRNPGAASAGVAPSSSAGVAPERSESAEASPASKHPTESAEAHGSLRSRSHHTRAAQDLPAQPDRAQVMVAMNALRPEVSACFGEKHGSATAEIRAAGRTGRVTSARVQGQTGSVGSCIARAVRKARFPRFAAESITISYPFAH